MTLSNARTMWLMGMGKIREGFSLHTEKDNIAGHDKMTELGSSKCKPMFFPHLNPSTYLGTTHLRIVLCLKNEAPTFTGTWYFKGTLSYQTRFMMEQTKPKRGIHICLDICIHTVCASTPLHI